MATLHRDRGREGWGWKVIRRVSGFGKGEDEDGPEDEDGDEDGLEDEEAEGVGQVVRWL